MARPQLEIDAGQVEKLAGIGATMEEIGYVVGCSVDTLERRFAETIEKGRARFRASLRRLQYKRAVDGSDTMLIWLGKQHLGQRDNLRTESDISITVTDNENPKVVREKLKTLLEKHGITVAVGPDEHALTGRKNGDGAG